MRIPSLMVPVALMAAAACGPENAEGFLVAGDLTARVTDAAGATTDTGFRFTEQRRILRTLPSGMTAGVTGFCQIGANSNTVHLQQVGGNTMGMTTADITLPAFANTDCTACEHGQISVQIGQTTFSGSETRGGTVPSSCTFTYAQRGAYGMAVTVTCPDLTTQNDARHVALSATNFTADECDGPSSGGP